MTDEGIEPEGYPEHDADWRRERTECKRDVRDALKGYDGAVQAAVLSELLSAMVEGQAERQFVREWQKMADDQ